MSEPVWVLDSSAIFDIKREVPAAEQWQLARTMHDLVEGGAIAICHEVVREARGQRHTDLPEAWLLGVEALSQHPTECDLDTYVEVMHSVGPLIVDPDAESDPADPWVLGLAKDLEQRGYDATVVTHDDGLTTACQAMGVAVSDLAGFLEVVRGVPPAT